MGGRGGGKGIRKAHDVSFEYTAISERTFLKVLATMVGNFHTSKTAHERQ